MVKEKKSKLVLAVIGVLLTLFGLIGTIFILSNQQYILWLLITGLSVVVGIILIALVFND